MVIVKQPSSASAADSTSSDAVDKLLFPSEFTRTNRQSVASTLPPPAYDLPLPILDPQPISEPKKRIRKRLRIGLAVALVLYVSVTTVLLVLLWTGRLGRRRRPPPPPPGGFVQGITFLPPFTRPQGAPEIDGFADACNQWAFNPRVDDHEFDDEFDHPGPKGPQGMNDPLPDMVDHLTYQLPLNTSITSLTKLFIRTDGVADLSGTFTVISDDFVDVPTVEVQMKYRYLSTRNCTNVCLMRIDDRVGLGIYSAEASLNDPPTFDVILHVPGDSYVDELVTSLPSFTQNIGQSNRIMTTHFGLLQLRGDFSPIYVRGSNVISRRVQATTSFSVIYGKFTTSGSLILKTSEAAIDVNVTLVRESSEDPPVILQMTTENAIVRTVITLAAAPDTLNSNATLPDFYIQATSANAPIAVDISHQDDSVATRVEVDVSTEFAPAVVSIDPKYEGTFTLYSDLPGEIRSNQNVLDPEGLDRRRDVEVDEQTSDRLLGHVEWRDEGRSRPQKRAGSLTLTTKSARAKLYLEDKCFWSCNTNDQDSKGSRRMPLR